MPIGFGLCEEPPSPGFSDRLQEGEVPLDLSRTQGLKHPWADVLDNCGSHRVFLSLCGSP